jgi:hypothetical protein
MGKVIKGLSQRSDENSTSFLAKKSWIGLRRGDTCELFFGEEVLALLCGFSETNYFVRTRVFLSMGNQITQDTVIPIGNKKVKVKDQLGEGKT